MANRSDERSRPRLYSPKLLGVEGPECPIPKCRAPGRTASTGWMEYGDLDQWSMEFTCPDHGPVLGTGADWSRLIDAVLKEQGRSPPA